MPSVVSLPVASIIPNPDQPRKQFDHDQLAALAASIVENGLMQPITVQAITPQGEAQYMIVAGERRWRAHRLAGLSHVSALAVEVDDARRDLLAIIENLQRADISPLEEARAFQRMLDQGWTVNELAQRLGLKQPWRITDRTQLLRLVPAYLDLLEKHHLSPSQGFELSRLSPAGQATFLTYLHTRIKGLPICTYFSCEGIRVMWGIRKPVIYPGLVSTGKVVRGGDKPYHTVINGENYHVLKALTWTHRGKVDAIYIDPPYNTGAKDWKYNNDYVEGDDLYRHSKWLAMMERRLLIAKELLNPQASALIVTIDEKEVHRLGLLLEQIFLSCRIQMVTMRLNQQDGGLRQCISVTNNEVSADEQLALRKKGLRAGDAEWEQWGICDYITKPRVHAAITGNTPENEPIQGDYKFMDEIPMAEGFEENAEFFTLTYESPVAVTHHMAFARIAPMLWLRAGGAGRRIDKLPAKGYAVVDAYGLLVELDGATDFLKAVGKAKDLRVAYIVTDDERRFQALARRLPEGVEAIRLYESYLTNFSFANGD